MATSRLKIHVQPRASTTGVVGMHGDAVRIRLASPPVDNAANEELITLIAGRLGIAKRCVRVVAGRTSRRKVVEIDGVTAASAAALLLAGS